MGLDDACLTGATSPPAGTESNLGPCGQLGSGSPPLGTAPGYLQLTDNQFNRVGAILYNKALPASGGIDITFDTYQYGGKTSFAGPAGADGISFFLVNGAASLTSPGAYGGSLGYAQNGSTPGVHAGLLGVGLDVFGNYANDAENRGNGCAVRQPGVGTGGYYGGGPGFPDAVGVRGPGDGRVGYCWVDGDLNLPGQLYSSTATGKNTAPALRTVHVQVTSGGLITV